MSNHIVRVLTFTGFYLPGYKGGGPIKTVMNLLERTGTDIIFKLVTGDRDLGDSLPYSTVECGGWNRIGGNDVYYAQPGLSGLLQIAKILSDDDYDILYLNSFFSIRFSYFPLLFAKLLGKKIVLGPRGEFSEGALGIKLRKKRLFILVYKLLHLHKGIVFQASSKFEAEDICRALGSDVDVRIAEDIGSQDFAETIVAKKTDTLKGVFVSRISPMKNLLGAIKMLGLINGPLCYDIYGPIEDDYYWLQCEEAIKALPANVKVNYKGPLEPRQVASIIAGYDFFYMPTFGENYGHVIAEALCAGLPLVIADTTPWRGIREKGLGWDLSLAKPEAFAAAIDALSSMSPEHHLKMRENVLAWAKHKFAQKDAVEANIAMFRYAYEK